MITKCSAHLLLVIWPQSRNPLSADHVRRFLPNALGVSLVQSTQPVHVLRGDSKSPFEARAATSSDARAAGKPTETSPRPEVVPDEAIYLLWQQFLSEEYPQKC
ncbi:hypothetical protein BgiBS90_036503 [Biomphalaria glabrata]|nr:hypothetical protein BgiBS90_036503 [Biomphalaria glabrata]